MVKISTSYISRHLTPDSIVPNPADPQSWNRYSYALNNPIKNIDPTGHIAICFGGGPTENIQTDEEFDATGFSGICNQALIDSGYDEEIHGKIYFLRNGYNAQKKAYDLIVSALKEKDQPVIIVGYSWGGSAAIELTENLNTNIQRVYYPHADSYGITRKAYDKNYPIEVDLLILLDPEVWGRVAARDIPERTIPDNVKQSFWIDAASPNPNFSWVPIFQDGSNISNATEKLFVDAVVDQNLGWDSYDHTSMVDRNRFTGRYTQHKITTVIEEFLTAWEQN